VRVAGSRNRQSTEVQTLPTFQSEIVDERSKCCVLSVVPAQALVVGPGSNVADEVPVSAIDLEVVDELGGLNPRAVADPGPAASAGEDLVAGSQVAGRGPAAGPLVEGVAAGEVEHIGHALSIVLEGKREGGGRAHGGRRDRVVAPLAAVLLDGEYPVADLDGLDGPRAVVGLHGRSCREAAFSEASPAAAGARYLEITQRTFRDGAAASEARQSHTRLEREADGGARAHPPADVAVVDAAQPGAVP